MGTIKTRGCLYTFNGKFIQCKNSFGLGVETGLCYNNIKNCYLYESGLKYPKCKTCNTDY
jgi:hypothetical protein